MICDDIIDKIPKLIRREIDTNERIATVEHLKSCNPCRTEYLNQLKMFYLLDKGLINKTTDIDKSHYCAELENKLSTDQKLDSYQHYKLYVYAAAAVLLFIIISIFIFNNNKQVIKTTSEDIFIEKALLNEDWVTLRQILKSNQEIKKRADEKISISLLIEKLIRLEKQGIRSIDYIDLFNEANNFQNFYPSSNQDTEINQIQINKLVQTLEDFKTSKSEITLYEIGLFLAENNRGGTKS
jgi:hypothetical protein